MTTTEHPMKASLSPIGRLKEALSSPFGKKKSRSNVFADEVGTNETISNLKSPSSEDTTKDSSSVCGSTTTMVSTISKSKKRTLRRRRAKKNRQIQGQANTTDDPVSNSSIGTDSDNKKNKNKRKKKKRSTKAKSIAAKDVQSLPTVTTTPAPTPTLHIIDTTDDTTSKVTADLMEDTGRVEMTFDEFNDSAVKMAVEVTPAEAKPDVYAADNEPVQLFGQPSKNEDCECNACVIS